MAIMLAVFEELLVERAIVATQRGRGPLEIPPDSGCIDRDDYLACLSRIHRT